jgi:hypothetical protein
MSESRNNTRRAFVTCSLWLYIGFIGAGALAAGLLRLFDDEPRGPRALALAFFGGVLAAASWRRGLIAAEHAEPASAIATDEPSESISRAFSRQTRPGATAVPSLIP